MEALRAHQKPDRVPVIPLTLGFAALNAGYNLNDFYFEPQKCVDALRWTNDQYGWQPFLFIEAVSPVIQSDADLYAYYERLRMKKDANATRVATARRLLTIVYCVLSQERLYERRNRRVRRNLAPVALVTSQLMLKASSSRKG
jgi:hypothetical protein